MSRPPRVAALVPMYRVLDPAAYMAIRSMANYSQNKGIDIDFPVLHMNCYVHWARNDSLKSVRQDADFILFCDDDMVPEPDSLLRLLAWNEDVVSGLTTTRSLPPKLNVKAYDPERDDFFLIEAVKPDALLKGQFAVGTGFVLVKHRVIRAVREQFLTARDWTTDNAALHERLGADPIKVEAERHSLESRRRDYFRKHGKTKLFHLFDKMYGEELGEDVSFSRRLIQLGIPVCIDTACQIGHLGGFPYGPWNLGMTKPQDVDLTPE